VASPQQIEMKEEKKKQKFDPHLAEENDIHGRFLGRRRNHLRLCRVIPRIVLFLVRKCGEHGGFRGRGYGATCGKKRKAST
jgi:hypothetical protein